MRKTIPKHNRYLIRAAVNVDLSTTESSAKMLHCWPVHIVNVFRKTPQKEGRTYNHPG